MIRIIPIIETFCTKKNSICSTHQSVLFGSTQQPPTNFNCLPHQPTSNKKFYPDQLIITSQQQEISRLALDLICSVVITY